MKISMKRLPAVTAILLVLWSCSLGGSYLKYEGKGREIRKKIVEEALEQEGAPYRYSGITPRGFDCSGLVYYIASQNDITLPRSSVEQAKAGRKISLDSSEPGDLIFFDQGGRINHVGIIVRKRGSEVSFIHSSSSRGVVIDVLGDSDYWNKRFSFATRIVD